MNENDVLEVTIEEMAPVNGGSKKNFGLGMLIGGGLALAALAGGKKLKKVWSEHKAKKEQQDVVDVEAEEVED